MSRGPVSSTSTILIRHNLERIGYTEPRILELLQTAAMPSFRQRREMLPLFLWRTRVGTPLDILVRLFLLRQTLTRDAVRGVLEPTEIEKWKEAGLVIFHGAEVSAVLELCPCQGLLVAADWSDRNETLAQPVMPIAGTSRDLAAVTVRRPVARTLDVGTGCGILAFLATAHSTQVVGVDCNPRAIRLARFSACLNGLSNVELLEGNLFEPVRGRAFDLIVCNPPFVIAPGEGHLHSYSGRPADQLCESIVRTAPRFLSEGGFCQILCNWAVSAGEDWQTRLASWMEGTGCDAWVMYSNIQDVASYALQRIHERGEAPERIGQLFEQWMAYYQRERIEAVGFGLVTLRRSSRSANWFRCERLPELKGPCGDSIASGFALRDFLEANRDDAVFLQARLRPAVHLRWEQEHEVTARGLTPLASRLRLGAGLSYIGDANPEVVAWVSRSSGDQTLGNQLVDLAAATGQDPQNLTPAFLRVVRRLLELGLLVPA